MDLRHLRYFIAVAEEGSLTLAARRLHTAQPSLSRQIRDLEYEVGAPLLTRTPQGAQPTAAGRAFLDHARIAIAQADAAKAAARRAAHPAKDSFVLGFLTGYEVAWLGKAMRVLQDELPAVDVTICSGFSPDLATAVVQGRIDVAFMRREENIDGLSFRTVARDPLVVILPGDHRLARRKSLAVADLSGEPFITVSKTAPTLRAMIAAYIRKSGVDLSPHQEVDHLSMAISMIASTRSVALLPAYARSFLPSSIVSRPLKDGPAIDLVLGYRGDTGSAVCRRFIERAGELAAA